MSLTPKRLLSKLGQNNGQGLRFGEIADQLHVTKKDHHRLRRLLKRLLDQGQIVRIKHGRYAVVANADKPLVVGCIRVHPAGYGFLQVENNDKDIFIPAKYRGEALDGDRVSVSTWEGYKGTEGRVEGVLSRGRAKLTGTLVRKQKQVVVEPDDPRIASSYGQIKLDKSTQAAKVGQAVLVAISRYPTQKNPEIAGRIETILGDANDPRTEIKKIIACADIPGEFSQPAREAATATPQQLLADDLVDRIDLRDRPFVTIDPETARDFDDALCIEKRPNHTLRVWVAVADVSHYVRQEEALDQEAIRRGVSVYLPDQVIPMLPFELSSGVCSLNPNVDRLAMVVRLDYAANGTLLHKGFGAAVINSHARLDYPGVAAALQGHFGQKRAHYRQWVPTLRLLAELSQKLRAKRLARGALDLELPEPKVILDADDPRLVRDVVRAKGSEDIKQAYQLIEEYMIAANEAVGSYFREWEWDTIWRRHDPPTAERLQELATILDAYGIKLAWAKDLNQQRLKQVVQSITALQAGPALTFLVLRSLKQATYDTESQGHFGLASADYLHFTSPIRRYPDLLVHRLLKFHLHQDGYASGGGGNLQPLDQERLQELAVASSTHERRAMQAERDAVAMYRAHLMRDRLGETFSAKVSGVTQFGVFVETEEPFVEGLIRLDELHEPMEFDPLRQCITGRVTGWSLGLGDTVEVTLTNVSVSRRQIDFALTKGAVEHGHRHKPKKRNKTNQRSAQAPKRGQTRASTRRRQTTRNDKTTSKAGSSKGKPKEKSRSKRSARSKTPSRSKKPGKKPNQTRSKNKPQSRTSAAKKKGRRR